MTEIHPIDPAPVSYRLTFDDGATIDACADHLWLTYDADELADLTTKTDEWRSSRQAKRASRATGKRSQAFMDSIIQRNKARDYDYKAPPTGTIRTTQLIADTLLTKRGRRNHAVPVALPLDLPDAELPIDPYVLGAWLGDGHSATGAITCYDPEILAQIELAGYGVRRVPSTVSTFRIVGFTADLMALQREMIGTGAKRNKHIPPQYLRASVAQRLALVQGLMDTDGYADQRGACEFTTTSVALRDGFGELMASLGIKGVGSEGRATLDGRDCGPKYRFKFRTTLEVFRLGRKRDRQGREPGRRTRNYRYIVACDRIDPKPMRCITVDSASHLYLAGRQMIPTHNTHGLLLEAVRNADVKGFAAVIFRRQATQITSPGGLWDQSQDLYPLLGGVQRSSPHPMWRFRPGAAIQMRHLQRDADVYAYQGAQIPLICFDELTHFTRKQFFFMLSRNRSLCGVKPYMRATCNPDADSWVADLLAWWINQETGLPIPERDGVVRYFTRVGDDLVWGDSRAECALLAGVRPLYVKSITFIAASIHDNKILMEKDPGYLANLMALTRVERERLLGGNWKVRNAPGSLFRRTDVPIIEQRPTDVIAWVRRWDLAATVPSEDNPDPDWTAGVLMGLRANGRFVVADVQRCRKRAAEVRTLIGNTTMHDGALVTVVVPQDPGQAGKDQAANLIAGLAGSIAKSTRETGKKEIRAEPFASQWQAGNVDVVRGAWNEAFFNELEGFPSSLVHDDQVDAASGAFAELKASALARFMAMSG